MRLDPELIRKMLLAIEDDTGGWAPMPLKIDGYTDQQIGYHSLLLMDAGYAVGSDVTTNGPNGPEGMITRLTYKGHEFAAGARDEGRWSKAITQVKSSAGTVSLDILGQLLGSMMRGTLGIQ